MPPLTLASRSHRIEELYSRSPLGISGPTNFVHQVHVGFDPNSGNFTGLPKEWKSLLEASNISKEEMSKNPQAVLDVLEFYTENLVSGDDDNNSSSSPRMDTPPEFSGASGKANPPPRAPHTMDTHQTPPPAREEYSESMDSVDKQQDKPSPPQPRKKPHKERLSTLTEAQIMEKLKSVVSHSDPSVIYTKIKKVGQGASGSVVGRLYYVNLRGKLLVPGKKHAGRRNRCHKADGTRHATPQRIDCQ